MLHAAVENNKKDCIDLLVENKAKLDIKDKSGRTPIDVSRVSARWKQGTPVRVRSGVTPKHGWGNVSPGEVGKVMSQLGSLVLVDFKTQPDAWKGHEPDLEEVSGSLLPRDSSTSSDGAGLLLLALLAGAGQAQSYGACDKCKKSFSSPSQRHQCCKCQDYYCLECIQLVNRTRSTGLFSLQDKVKICPACLLFHSLLS